MWSFWQLSFLLKKQELGGLLHRSKVNIEQRHPPS
jgi:hypothetical protein